MDPREPAAAAPPIEDRELLRRHFKGGDRTAMEELFRRHAEAAYRVALTYARNAADAEDVVQTAFLQVLRTGESCLSNEGTNIRGWIMTIVINACRKKFREESSRLAREDAVAKTPAEHVERDPELLQKAMSLAKGLPEQYRLPVWLHYLEGYTYREVGAALALPESTVRSQASRGLEQIREALVAAGLASASLSLPEVLAAAPLPALPAGLYASFEAVLAKTAVTGAGSMAGASVAKGISIAAAAKGLLALSAITAVTIAVMSYQPSSSNTPPPVTRKVIELRDPLQTSGKNWYAHAKAGDEFAMAGGTPADPLTLADAARTALPGDTVWLQGGVYSVTNQLSFNGTAEKPIVVRPCPGESVVFSGFLNLAGSHTWYCDLEFTGPVSAKIPTGASVITLSGNNLKLLNSVLHNVGVSLESANGAELYGCTCSDIGQINFVVPGPGVMLRRFTQQPGTGTVLSENILCRSQGSGFLTTAYSGDLTVTGNVIFHSAQGPEYAGYSEVVIQHSQIPQLQFNENFIYQSGTGPALQLISNLYDGEFVFTANRFVGAADLTLDRCRKVRFTNNTLVSGAQTASVSMPGKMLPPGEWDDNNYFAAGTTAFAWDKQKLDPEAWKKCTGWDRKSVWSSQRPTGQQVLVRPNKYHPSRAHVIVLNWDLKSTAEADLSQILQVGQTYTVRDAQNYPVTIIDAIYDGKPVSLPMESTTIAQPQRFSSSQHTKRDFNVFVVNGEFKPTSK